MHQKTYSLSRTKSLVYFVLLVITFSYLNSCSSSNQTEDYTLQASITSSHFNADANNTTLNITTTGAWSVKEADNVNWLSFSPEEGAGNAKVAVSYTDNKTGKERFAQIVISYGSESVHIYISQKPAVDTTSNTYNGNYFELPKDTAIANCVKIVHFLPGVRSSMRNYTMLYDTQMKLAYWVAYPLTTDYLGGTSRTNDWQYDPSISTTYQPQLYNAYKDGYSRGHQIPSADRTYSADDNRTTYYFTNMTAQNYDLNAGIWADLESKIRTWTKSGVDTMYVVTGAMIKTKSDSSISYTTDNLGASIAVPKYYFKALAQKRGSLYYTIAFKINNEEPSSGDSYKNHSLSVSELEEETGFTFFPGLPESTKKEINFSIWTY